jgi:ABC-type phosphate transport system substrate-binding protein
LTGTARASVWKLGRLAGAVVALLLVVTTVLPVDSAGAASAITGGGSSFAALEIDQWRADTARKPYSLQVNYVSQGSTFGRTEFIENHLDYGASDITFQPAEMGPLQSKRCGGRAPDVGCFVYVPVSAGGLSFMYNLTDSTGSRVTNLRLSRQAACKIFTGAIKRWNDPELVATNPFLAGFSRDIVPVIRADGAGESFVLSQFCIAVAKPVWDEFRARQIRDHPENVATDFRNGSPVSNWPQEWGRAVPQPFADGTATTVADPVSGKDSITYVAAGYAKVRSFPVASLQNAAGVFTQPDEENVTVALGYATGRGDGTFNLNFTGPDSRAYFPSTYSYVLAQTTGFDPGKGAALGQFLCYAVSAGQVIAPRLRYARLSAPLVDIAIDAIVRIPGAPAKGSCFVKGAPPPPGLPDVVDPNGPGGTGATGTGGTTQEQQAAAAAAAAAEKQAREAALRAAREQRKQKSLDEALRQAAATHAAPADIDPIWLLLIGAGLAAVAVAIMQAVRRSR